jgi:chromosome segregation ATPase
LIERNVKPKRVPPPKKKVARGKHLTLRKGRYRSQVDSSELKSAQSCSEDTILESKNAETKAKSELERLETIQRKTSELRKEIRELKKKLKRSVSRRDNRIQALKENSKLQRKQIGDLQKEIQKSLTIEQERSSELILCRNLQVLATLFQVYFHFSLS